MNIQQYNKAIVPVGVAVVLFALNKLGVTPNMNVSDAVTAIITSLVVFLVPNKPAQV